MIMKKIVMIAIKNFKSFYEGTRRLKRYYKPGDIVEYHRLPHRAIDELINNQLVTVYRVENNVITLFPYTDNHTGKRCENEETTASESLEDSSKRSKSAKQEH